MDFSHPKPRRQSEPALPMINVVFLLQIFFLMSAQIVTPPPFEVTPPETESTERPGEDLRLHVSADGTLAFAETPETQVWEALAAIENPGDQSLLIRADATLAAAELAAILARTSALGFGQIQLATVPR